MSTLCYRVWLSFYNTRNCSKVSLDGRRPFEDKLPDFSSIPENGGEGYKVTYLRWLSPTDLIGSDRFLEACLIYLCWVQLCWVLFTQ